jgi:hypothetical protein
MSEIKGGAEPSDKKECNIIVPFSRVINSETRELPYHRRREEYKYTVHIGQRKLLLSEIEFLTHCAGQFKDKKMTIVYAGAANGTHIKLLAIDLFPKYEYYLYDPGQFDTILNDISNIHIHRQLFTKKTCETWKNRDDIIFISDIRRVPPDLDKNENSDEFEKVIKEDMIMQMEWYKIINPEIAMLKFHLPYCNPKDKSTEFTEYLAGTMYFQAWPGETSTETRLWINKNAKMIKYDNRKYESQLFRHNVCTRMQHFDLSPLEKKDILKFKGLEFDYDSRAELHIYGEYLKLREKEPSVDELLKMYKLVNELIPNPFKDGHGKYPLEKMSEQKKRKIQKEFTFEKKIQTRMHKREILKKKSNSSAVAFKLSYEPEEEQEEGQKEEHFEPKEEQKDEKDELKEEHSEPKKEKEKE